MYTLLLYDIMINSVLIGLGSNLKNCNISRSEFRPFHFKILLIKFRCSDSPFKAKLSVVWYVEGNLNPKKYVTLLLNNTFIFYKMISMYLRALSSTSVKIGFSVTSAYWISLVITLTRGHRTRTRGIAGNAYITGSVRKIVCILYTISRLIHMRIKSTILTGCSDCYNRSSVMYMYV